MRDGFRTGAALLLTAALVACGGDDDIDTFESDLPAAEEPMTAEPAADAPVMTAQFEAPEGGDQNVSGTATVYRADGAAMGSPSITAEETTTNTAGETEDPETPEMSASQTGTTGQGWRIEVTLNGLTDGEHAWHVHSGPCGEEAPVAVAFSPTADMEGVTGPLNVQNGSAASQATVPADQLSLDQLENGEYSIHVHERGGTDHGPTVACANLGNGMSM